MVEKTVTASPLVADSQTPNSDASDPNSLSAMQITTALKSAGLPISKSIEYDEATDPNDLLGRPNAYTQKVNWDDQRLKPSSSDPYNAGTIEVFSNPEDAKSRKEYIDKLGQASSLFGWYSFLEGNYLLRVAYDFTPEQARVYETAFRQILKSGEASPIPQESVAAPAAPKPLEVLESGWTLADGSVQYGVVLRNLNDAWGATSATLDIEMKDAAGDVLGADTNYAPVILPNQTIAISGSADAHGKRPAKVSFSTSVNEDYGWVPLGDSQLPDLLPFKATNVRLSQDEYGYWTITGLVKNPNDKRVTSVDVTAIARGASGRILFGVSNIIENVPASGSKAFELQNYWDQGQPVDSVDVYVRVYNR